MVQYKFQLIADNDHEALKDKLNAWLLDEKPERILETDLVTDGSEFTYCAMILYVGRKSAN
jgi:hypothetical protein